MTRGRPKGAKSRRAALRKYSVYECGTDRPIFINGTAKECAEAMGVTTNSFYKRLWSHRSGRNVPRDYEIFIDDEEDLDE